MGLTIRGVLAFQAQQPRPAVLAVTVAASFTKKPQDPDDQAHMTASITRPRGLHLLRRLPG